VLARSLAEWSVFGEFLTGLVDVFVYVAAFETTDGVLHCPQITAAGVRPQADGAIPPPAPRSASASPCGLAVVIRARIELGRVGAMGTGSVPVASPFK